MDLTLNSDQRALQQGLREVLAGLWSDERLRAASNGDAAGAEQWRQLAELGVFGVCAPAERGGMGLGLVDAAVLFEELGARLVPGPLVATVLVAALPGAAIDDAAFPGAAIDGSVLDGSAIVTALDTRDATLLVEHLDVATHVVLIADDGLRLASPADLRATALVRPLDPLTPVSAVTAGPGGTALKGVGEPIGDAAAAADWRARGAVLTAALQVGVARGGLDLAVRYAGERVQFDRPIGTFQSIKHLLAESLVRVDLARAAVWVAALEIDAAVADAACADAARAGDDDARAGHVSAGQAVATAKLLADDAAVTGGRTCVQVHGGMGFTWEVLAHLFMKRAWVHETAYGTADEHAETLAELLGA